MKDTIEQMKQWCQDHYEDGADTMVECWSTADYQDLLNDYGGNAKKAMSALKRIAAIYAERQADARNSAF
jgi:hypothetical protein